MLLNYSDRKIFWGNEALIIGDLVKVGEEVQTQNLKLVTGLVSVGSMEDQAETNNYPADDVPDHGQKKGATLLQGEMVFIQTDEPIMQDMLGQVKTANGLGWTPTGNFRSKIVQYLIKGRKRNPQTGVVEDGYKIMVFPKLTPTAEATSESETDSTDGVDPIDYTIAVQATANELYTNNGRAVPKAEYEVWGEQAKAFMEKMEEGLFIMFPDTVIGTQGTLTSPTISDVETATTGGNDGTFVIPSTLKNQDSLDVPVTSTIKKSNGATATNGQLAPDTYTITFSADGYPDVTTTAKVTDKA